MGRALHINTVVSIVSSFDKEAIADAETRLAILKQNKESDAQVIADAQKQLDALIAEKITWKIGIIPSDIFKKASRMKVAPLNSGSKKVEIISTPDEVLTNLVLVGLKGWSNFNQAENDKDGNPVPVEFKTKKAMLNGEELEIVDPDVLKVIAWEHQVDIANLVRKHNGANSGELKN